MNFKMALHEVKEPSTNNRIFLKKKKKQKPTTSPKQNNQDMNCFGQPIMQIRKNSAEQEHELVKQTQIFRSSTSHE